MNNLKCVASCIAIGLAGIGTAAGAQSVSVNFNPSWYIAPSINLLDPDSGWGTDDREAGVGLRLGKALSQSWDMQIGATAARSAEADVKYRQQTLGADFLYMFSRSDFRPFALLGVGLERDRLSAPGFNQSDTSWAASAGLGFQWAFSDQWFMQADLRHVHGFTDENKFGFDPSGNNYLTFSIGYLFGKPAPEPVAMAAPPPAPPPAPIPPPPPRFERITLSATELFGFDSDVLRGPSSKLDEIAQALHANSAIRSVRITGHTDRIGSEQYNQALSQRRAEAVKNYLVGKGVADSRLIAVGKGEAEPVVECKEARRADLIQCLEPNRRVEVEEIVLERKIE